MFKNNRSIKFVKDIKDFVISKNDFFTEILGEHCELEYTFYNELSVKLRFPYYFGRNFDALDECINDFEWFNYEGIYYNRILIYIKNPEKILSSLLEDKRKIFFEILQRIENKKVVIIFDEKYFDFLNRYNIEFLDLKIIKEMQSDLIGIDYNNYKYFFKKYESTFDTIINMEDKTVENMLQNFYKIKEIYADTLRNKDLLGLDCKIIKESLQDIKLCINELLFMYEKNNL